VLERQAEEVHGRRCPMNNDSTSLTHVLRYLRVQTLDDKLLITSSHMTVSGTEEKGRGPAGGGRGNGSFHVIVITTTRLTESWTRVDGIQRKEDKTIECKQECKESDKSYYSERI
jgi:hypothetical protein